MEKKISLSFLLATFVVGCTGHAVEGEPPGPLLMALDTSGSARESHGKFFPMAREAIESLPGKATLFLYRFDASPAEVYSNFPPGSSEEIGEMLNDSLKHRSSTDGTNLAKLFVQFDARIAELGRPVSILVFTDCGTEKMTRFEEEQVQRITKRWGERQLVDSLRFVGVQAGHREKLRTIVKLPIDKLQFR